MRNSRRWRGSGIAFSNLHPFRVVVVIAKQMLARGSVIFLDSSNVPAVVHRPEYANLLPYHTIGTEPVKVRNIIIEIVESKWVLPRYQMAIETPTLPFVMDRRQSRRRRYHRTPTMAHRQRDSLHKSCSPGVVRHRGAGRLPPLSASSSVQLSSFTKEGEINIPKR